jgi:hypothetical protein
MAAILASFGLVVTITLSSAKSDDKSDWWNSLRRTNPDGTRVSCCAEYDAVYADVWHLTANNMIEVTVTGRGPRNHAWAPIGKKYLVPSYFLVDGNGNKTGHALLFLNPNSLEPICFIPGVGI